MIYLLVTVVILSYPVFLLSSELWKALPKVESLHYGAQSMLGYTEAFTIPNLPNLKTLSFGDDAVGLAKSLSITSGISIIMQLRLDFDKLTSISFNGNAFLAVESLTISSILFKWFNISIFLYYHQCHLELLHLKQEIHSPY